MTTNQFKKDFPIFQHHPKLVYLDSTATSLKPATVVAAEKEYYEQYGVNIHRGIYKLSVTATEKYEAARGKIRKFINAKSAKEIVFVRGATEAINLVAATYGQTLKSGEAIVVSEMEHHANILPWGRLAIPLRASPSSPLSQGGAPELRWIPVTDDGQLDLSSIDELLAGAKLLAITQMSNVLGTVNDVKMLAQKAHAAGAKVLVDAAQSVPHLPVDVRDLDCDFLVFSGHKMLGPTGIGVLYAKQELLEQMDPYQLGGDMIREVTKEAATWNEVPYKFEAGTPNIAGAIGLGAAVDYLSAIGMDKIWAHEQELAAYGLEQLSKIDGLKVLGAATSPHPSLRRRGRDGGGTGGRGATLHHSPTAPVRGAIFAFTIEGIHPHDIGSILDERNIAVRAGHHCAMPLHQRFGVPATTRASCYLYNTTADIDALVAGLKKVREVFR